MLLRQAIVTPMTLGKGLFLLPFLAPNELLLWRLVQTWFGYATRASFGTFSALAFYLPKTQAAGDDDGGRAYHSVASYAALLGSLIAVGVGLALSAVSVGWKLALPLALWGATLLPRAYVGAVLQARGSFQKLAVLDTLQAVLTFVLPVGGVVWFGFSGLVVGQACGLVLVFVRQSPLPFLREAQPVVWAKARSILRDGFQLWLNGSLKSLASSLDINLVAFLIVSPTFGGQYAVALILCGFVASVAQSAYRVLHRRIVQDLAQLDDTVTSDEAVEPPAVETVFGRIVRFTVLDVLVLTVAGGFLLALLPVVPWLFPKYAGALPLVPLLLLGAGLTRARTYAEVPLKARQRFFALHASFLFQLAVTAVFFVVLAADGPSPWLAACQAVGAAPATLGLWLIVRRDLRGNIASLLRLAVVLSMSTLWLCTVDVSAVVVERSGSLLDVTVHLGAYAAQLAHIALGGLLVVLSVALLFPGSIRESVGLVVPGRLLARIPGFR